MMAFIGQSSKLWAGVWDFKSASIKLHCAQESLGEQVKIQILIRQTWLSDLQDPV